MKEFLSKPKVVAHGISLLILMSLASLYFFWYVPARSREFAQRNFRILAQTSEQIKMTIESLPESLRIAARSVETNVAPPAPRGSQKLAAGVRTNLEWQVRKAMDLIPALELIPHRPPEVELTTNATNSINIRIRPGSWVEFEHRASAGTNASLVVSINARANLSRLAPVPREFDGLLIAQDTGEVVFQRLPAGISIQKLKAQHAPSESDSNIVQQATSLITTSFAEGKYKFFVQPLHLSEALPSAETNNWLVCGVVRANRFESESREIAYIYLITFIFLVFFFALSVAFSKRAFADPREPLRRRDVMYLVIGTFGGSALITILALDYGFYGVAEDHLDGRLEPLAKSIKTNLNEEVLALHDVVQKLNELKTQRTYRASNSVTQILQNTVLAKITNSNPQTRFDTISWLGSNGVQTSKWTALEAITPLVDVSDRDYFRDALKDRRTSYAWQRDGTNQFWLQPIYNRATGENSAVLSIRSALGVAAIESRLQSVIRPVLPTGYGFCVVTADGQVLFHSDEGRNLRENLFQECDKTPLLRSAVISRANHELEGSYLGRTHHFFVTPINNSPWTLVVFRDEQILSAANFEVVIGSLTLLVMYFLIPALPIMVLLILWSLFLGQKMHLPALPSWLWPAEARTKVYWCVTAFNFVLALALITFMSSRFCLPALIARLAIIGTLAGLVVTVAALAFNAFLFKLLGRLPSPHWLTRYWRWSYVLALTSLVIIVAALPAFACFKIATDKRMKLFTKYGQFMFAKALDNQTERLKSDKLSALGWASQPTNRSVSGRWPWNIYPAKGEDMNYSDRSDPTNREPAPLFAWLHKNVAWVYDRAMPLHDPISVETRGLVDSRAQDNSWFWKDDSATNLTFHANFGRSLSLRDSIHLSSDLKRWPWVIAIVIVVLITLFPVCFMANRVFLIHVDRDSKTVPENGDTPLDQWKKLEDLQQLALFEVEKYGFLDANHLALPGLLEKGLLILTPRLMVKPALKDILQNMLKNSAKNSAPDPTEIYGKDFASESPWELMKGPVYLGLVAVSLLMFITQPEIYKIVFGVIAGFAAGPPAILELLSLFENKNKDKTDRGA